MAEVRTEQRYLESCQRYGVVPDPSFVIALRTRSRSLCPSRLLSEADLIPIADTLVYAPRAAVAHDPPRSASVSPSATPRLLDEEKGRGTGMEMVFEEQGGEDSAQHISQVSLRGSQLGSNGAELLAQVLKRTHSITHLDLSYCGVDARGIRAIAQALEYNTSLLSLSLAGNRLGLDGARALARALGRKAHALESLDVSNAKMGWHGLSSVLQATEACNDARKAAGTRPMKCETYGNLDLEEALNTVTHGLGLVLSILGGVAMLVKFWDTDRLKLASATIFTASMAMVYASSCFYHAFSKIINVKNVLHRLDKTAIYMLIAGTYTPFALVSLNGVMGWALFALVWGIGIFGITLDMVAFHKYLKFKLCLYLIMGWACCVIAVPALTHPNIPLSLPGVIWLAFGGISYTSGVYWFVKEDPMDHVWWHIFVLGGTLCHYVCIFNYVMPEPYPSPPVDKWYYSSLPSLPAVGLSK